MALPPKRMMPFFGHYKTIFLHIAGFYATSHARCKGSMPTSLTSLASYSLGGYDRDVELADLEKLSSDPSRQDWSG